MIELDKDQKLKLGDYGEITIHNQNQFELTLDYKAAPEVDQSNYHLEAYFFLPISFRIIKENYPKKRFYEDLQVYIRFNPIQISLNEILNPKNQKSPLNRALDLLNKKFGGDVGANIEEGIIHELKMLAVIVVSVLERSVERIKDLLSHYPITDQNFSDARNQVNAFINSIQHFNQQFRQRRVDFHSSLTPKEVEETFEFVLEYISISIQRELTKLFKIITLLSTLELEEIEKKIRTLIEDEHKFRLRCGFSSILIKGEENESFPYRYSILKKYVSNVLYLTARPEIQGKLLKEVGYASAAGIAMLLTVILTFLSQTFFEEYTLPFIVVIVFAYILKDRLKEWLRLILGDRSGFRGKPDFKSTIKDEEGNKIGKTTEKFAFINKLPGEISNLRNIDHLTKIEQEGKPEVIIKYTKDIQIYPKVITSEHARVLDVSDIIRFDISGFLSKIENPYRYFEWYNFQNQLVETVKAAKVYHLNFIVKFSKINHTTVDTSMHRVCLILDKDGIKRIDPR
ncbi:hypothetical protein [Candidatus Hodarchaeum mangrovi]